MKEKKDEGKESGIHHHETHKKRASEKFKLEYVYLGLIVLLGIVLLFNIFLTFGLNKEMKNKSADLQEKLKPGNIEITTIKNSKCRDCSDVAAVINGIKNSKLNITKETTLEFDSKEAKSLISKYKIEKIPAVILTGEIDKVSIQGLEKKDDALLLSNILPPYTNAVTGKVEGKVTIYILKDASCVKCNNLDVLIAQIRSSGIKIYSQKNFTKDSPEGQEMIKKYKIDFVPSLVLSEEAGVYGIIQNAWAQIGTKENDGNYVLRAVYPPYINLTTGELKGLVKITYLTDKSCAECYNVSIHEQILASPQSFAIKLDKKELYDISDAKGKELIAKYNITSVPTVILSKEVMAYPIYPALKQFFTVADDSSFVFRAPQVLGTYKDLSTDKVVKQQQQSQQQNPVSETQPA